MNYIRLDLCLFHIFFVSLPSKPYTKAMTAVRKSLGKEDNGDR